MTALKIEGRQRSRAYVGQVVAAFRAVLDALARGEEIAGGGQRPQRHRRGREGHLQRLQEGLAMSALTLGPILFNWKPERRRDFYFRIADEAPVDCVYLGEVVCSKREPFFVDDLPAIAERLRAAGKQVVLSTLALVTTDREMEAIRERCDGELMIEANDVASIKLLAGAPHVAGPFVNVFNEATLDFLVRGGAVRVNMPVELSAAAIATLARHNPVETEAHGVRPPDAVDFDALLSRARLRADTRTPASSSASSIRTASPPTSSTASRCWSSTARRPCRTATPRCFDELDALQAAGVTHFRLSPQTTDMVKVAELYRAVLDRRIAPEEALAELRALVAPTPFVNGYIRGREGMSFPAAQRTVGADDRGCGIAVAGR